MGKRAIPLRDKTGSHLGWLIECPGCRCAHVLDSRWSFNGDVYKPTFRASLMVNASNAPGHPRCHSFITDGKIRFLLDSTHALAGLTVELPEF